MMMWFFFFRLEKHRGRVAEVFPVFGEAEGGAGKIKKKIMREKGLFKRWKRRREKRRKNNNKNKNKKIKHHAHTLQPIFT